jgi:replicative DNA helicase
MVLTQPETEAAFLGYLLLRGAEGFFGWPAAPSYFAAGQRRAVFLAIAALAYRGESIEPATVLAETRRQGSEVRADFLADLVDGAAASGGAVLGILRDLATRRAMGHAAQLAHAAALDGTQEPGVAMDAILTAFARETAALGRLEDAPPAPVLEATWLDRLARGADRRDRIQTGLLDLDDDTPGELPRGEVTIVGARTSIGKTAFVAQVAAWNAAQGRPVLFASAEMTGLQLITRWKAAQNGIRVDQLLRGRVSAAELAALRAHPLPAMRVYDKAAMTTADIRALVARVAVTAAPVALVAVDHLHHLADPLERGESRYSQVGRMVAALKDVAKAHGCAMLVAAQLNRHAADHVPSLADLRDAGTIEEFASVVLLLHRSEETPTICDVHVAKHRNGPTGRVRLHYDPAHVRFQNFTRAEYGAAPRREA